MNNTELAINRIKELLLIHGPKVIGAVVVLILGLWVIRLLVRAMARMMEKRIVDPSLIPFVRGLVGAVLKVGLIISVIQMVGIETTSFIAVLGAAGLAVGMALSGTLQNFAGGVMILLFKPYKAGDLIEAQGHLGTVHSIQIFNTILKTLDNKTVILPNAPVSTGSIVNFSTEPQRRVDMTFGIGYDADIDAARGAITELINADKRILKDPAPQVVVGELADSSVNFTVRVWARSEDYWGVFFDMHEQVKKTFDAKSISIPFPQIRVHSD
ncbi:MAG: mechanosensitive ion channel [Flavobacteriales bacterium]|jgi:small conductance mechanosensitive channel|nr:mechanosensitive ion channel [Flavobacteriales bacterium]MBK6893209.1 mechanosensitive ion channel [Flavobacteriales bacterium]MBK7249058.1 mechanosensitive ion channel [Flavobacteriales bacterium]MBK7285632.1 mechanosensitive ion channel [Flavobacteriales bacterium]MBK9058693.1 mechanosensitive ion channel [Flavobacteriales bacterium]